MYVCCLQPGVPAFTVPQPERPLEVLRDRARESPVRYALLIPPLHPAPRAEELWGVGSSSISDCPSLILKLLSLGPHVHISQVMLILRDVLLLLLGPMHCLPSAFSTMQDQLVHDIGSALVLAAPGGLDPEIFACPSLLSCCWRRAGLLALDP